MKKYKQAYSVDNILKKRFYPMDFSDTWKESLGQPDRAFSALIWAPSSSGKTSFALQFAKYLTNFGKVAYNSLEEGISHTMQMAIDTHNLRSCSKKFILLDREPWQIMMNRINNHKSAQFLFIDSIQYTRVSIDEYKQLKELMKHKRKALIIISHALGREPKGALANFIRYDVDIKIPIYNYRAFPEGRLNGGGKYFDIWKEKTKELWAEVH